MRKKIYGLFFPKLIIALLLLAVIAVWSSDLFSDNKYNDVCADNEYYGQYSLSYMPIYLDGYEIQGYYCDEKVLISIDDMTRYGFELNYDPEKNVLNLRSTSEIAVYPYKQSIAVSNYIAEPSSFDVRINGIKIYAYCLDGYACVSVDDLVYLSDEYNIQTGWSDYNMCGGYDASANAFNINCFRFKVNDWAELLAQMESKVNQTEIDIYTEGKPEEATYYGAKLEPRSGIYAGIVSDGNGNPEDGSPETFHHDFGVYSSYLEFDDFQTQLNKPSSYIVPEKNCISQVPWNVVDINLVLDSANDEYIKETLDNMAKYNKPTIIRFGAEMNIGYLGDSPTAYIKAFRKIADMVHEYPNFAVMWSPNDNGSLDRPFGYFYPGDEYVDWIGVSSFLKKDFLNSLAVEDGSEVCTTRESQIYFTLGDFGYTTNSLKYITDFMKENNINKPLAISEGGVVSRISYSDENIDLWGEKRVRNMYWYAAMRFPQLKSIVYFNHDMKSEVIGFDLSFKPNYTQIIEEAITTGPYLLSYNETPKYTFVKADGGRTYNSDYIPIYGYVYQPEQYTNYVEYYIDGNLLDTKTEIPYKTYLNKNSVSDGTHTLTITAHGAASEISKSYTLVKEAGNIVIY